MKFTLVLTICLVVMVIFLFLRNVSATLIPGVAVPLSIIGTFAVMYLLGYSLNNLSLMALTLSVGFVVDDAIVMLENIVRHMEMGEDAHGGRASRLARDRLHHRLHDHLAGGGVHPGAVHGRHRGPAAARVRRHHHGRDPDLRLRLADASRPCWAAASCATTTRPSTGVVYRVLEAGFEGMTQRVRLHAAQGAAASVRHRDAVAFAMLGGTVYLFLTMPTGFIPSQDSGFLFGITMAGQDISFDPWPGTSARSPRRDSSTIRT